MTSIPKIIDRLHAAVEGTAANPESITWIPDTMSSAQRNHFHRLLGIQDALKAAAALDGTIDMGIIDAALSKTKLSIADRMKAKVLLFGSGFSRGNN